MVILPARAFANRSRPLSGAFDSRPCRRYLGPAGPFSGWGVAGRGAFRGAQRRAGDEFSSARSPSFWGMLSSCELVVFLQNRRAFTFSITIGGVAKGRAYAAIKSMRRGRFPDTRPEATAGGRSTSIKRSGVIRSPRRLRTESDRVRTI